MDQATSEALNGLARPLVHAGVWHRTHEEVFRPGPILTVLDVPSGYVLDQVHAEHRDEATWTRTLHDVQARLPVVVVQGVGDEAKGLVNALEKGLGVPHHTDVFHPQLDVTRATSAALRVQVNEAHEQLARRENEAGAHFSPERLHAQGQVHQAELLAGQMKKAVKKLSDAMAGLAPAVGPAATRRRPPGASRSARAGARAISSRNTQPRPSELWFEGVAYHPTK